MEKVLDIFYISVYLESDKLIQYVCSVGVAEYEIKACKCLP